MKLVSYNDGYDHQPEHDLTVVVELSNGIKVELVAMEHDFAENGVIVYVKGEPS